MHFFRAVLINIFGTKETSEYLRKLNKLCPRNKCDHKLGHNYNYYDKETTTSPARHSFSYKGVIILWAHF